MKKLRIVVRLPEGVQLQHVPKEQENQTDVDEVGVFPAKHQWFLNFLGQ
jgi:hypothetical protein